MVELPGALNHIYLHVNNIYIYREREKLLDQVNILNPIWIRWDQMESIQLFYLVTGAGDVPAVEPSEPEEASERQEAIRSGWVEALSEIK